MKRFWMVFLLTLLALPALVNAQDQKVVWDLSKDNYIDVKDLGFRFYYPKGWVFDTSDGIRIAENQADLDAQIDNDNSTQPKGEVIIILGVKLSNLTDLPADAKLDDAVNYVEKQVKFTETDRVEVPIMTRRSISVFGQSSDGRSGI